MFAFQTEIDETNQATDNIESTTIDEPSTEDGSTVNEGNDKGIEHSPTNGHYNSSLEAIDHEADDNDKDNEIDRVYDNHYFETESLLDNTDNEQDEPAANEDETENRNETDDGDNKESVEIMHEVAVHHDSNDEDGEQDVIETDGMNEENEHNADHEGSDEGDETIKDNKETDEENEEITITDKEEYSPEEEEHEEIVDSEFNVDNVDNVDDIVDVDQDTAVDHAENVHTNDLETENDLENEEQLEIEADIEYIENVDNVDIDGNNDDHDSDIETSNDNADHHRTELDAENDEVTAHFEMNKFRSASMTKKWLPYLFVVKQIIKKKLCVILSTLEYNVCRITENKKLLAFS